MKYTIIQYNGYVAIADLLGDEIAIIKDGDSKLEFCRKVSDRVRKEVEDFARDQNLI